MLPYRKCPICRSNDATGVFDRRIENFDGIDFNRNIVIVRCEKCGCIYNDGAVGEDILAKYYQNETLYSGESGFGTGGTTPADVNRYSRYLDFLKPYISSKDIRIADIGCGKGGLLSFLKEKGFINVAGVEIDPKCADYARTNFKLTVDVGSVNDLPFGKNAIDMLIYNHVLEHLDEPVRALDEAAKALKNGGLVFIEVPDASRYSEGRVFDYFWFCMREHINHFDITHLSMLMELAGFLKVDEYRSLMPYNSRYNYPSLCALYGKKGASKKSPHEPHLELDDALRKYISGEDEILKKHRALIQGLAEAKIPVYCWGLSLEFFALYSLTDLRRCNIRGFLDKNSSKQKKCIAGSPVLAPEILKNATPDSTVIISSVFNAAEMARYLSSINYKGNVMRFDEY
jgi:SAM-dependent methyltransferase